MPDVLVTGATGFIGSHLVEALLNSGKTVACLVRPHRDVSRLQRSGIRFHQGDLMRPESLKGCCDGVDTVYHLGAHSALGTRNARDLEVNTTGAVNLLKEASTSGSLKRFILMSSLAAAGRPPGQRLRPLGDTSDSLPDTPYGRSKRKAEIAVRTLCGEAKIPYVILRPALVYGPRSLPDAGMNALMRAVETGRLISRFDLPGRISVVYVKDLVRVCLLAGTHPDAANRTFFVSSDPPVTFGELFRTIRQVLGRRYTPNRLAHGLCQMAGAGYDWLDKRFGLSGLIPSYFLAPLSASLACESTGLQQLGYRANYPLSLGLSKTLRT